jgi:hypothetical protein
MKLVDSTSADNSKDDHLLIKNENEENIVYLKNIYHF